MEYIWKKAERSEESKIEELKSQINVDRTIANILIQRGVETFDEAKSFFRPDLSTLHDPFLMQDMETASERILQAISKEEKILVYGDYDVDGTTAVSLVFSFLQSFYPNVEFYIPDRYQEGYGVSEKGVRYAADNGFSLIIALDCGIKAVDMVQLAGELGVDFIICDHHNPGETLPPAVAVLDPKRKDCNYPYKELSGCGVGFKLCEALCVKLEKDKTELYPYLDLVVVSIAADIVPITGENRTLAFFGLKQISKSPSPGLEALKQAGHLENDITISDIVFKIGPRINASGRLEHAEASVELLISKSLEEAKKLADAVDKVNSTRRNFDENISREAFAMIAEREDQKEWNSTVLYKEDWHKGVIGIVASRCIEQYYRPTIILTESNGKATGSARSVVDFNIYKAIAECSDLLEQFGGHKYAAGLTMDIANVAAFQEKFEEVVKRRIKKKHRTPVIEADDELSIDLLNHNFYGILKQMAPFGPGNPEPVFIIKNVRAENVTILKEKHLKFTIKQEGGKKKLVCLAFGMVDKKKDPNLTTVNFLRSKIHFNLAGEIRENVFRGQSTLQVYVKDIKFD